MTEKVYCKDCVHVIPPWNWRYAETNSGPYCKAHPINKSSEYDKWVDYPECSEFNSGNNCPDFKKKLTLWEKIKKLVLG